MGHQLFAASLVPPRTRTAAAVPVSMGVHAAALGALLALPLLARGANPAPVNVRPPVIDTFPVPVAIVTVAPAPVPARPGPRAARARGPQLPAATTPATIPVPLTFDHPPLAELEDDGPACVGCEFTTGPATNGDAAPGMPLPGGDGTDPRGTGTTPLVVGPQVTAPAKLRHVEPTYPDLARRAGVQGKVVIECLIGADGRVARARVVRSVPLLDAAAVAAVEQWTYRPTLVNGVAVPVLMTVTVNFSLR